MHRQLHIACAVLFGVVAGAVHAEGYSIQNGRIHDPAGRAVTIRGINHFGFSDPILVPQYLWEMGWRQQIAQIKALGFNAVRVPFAPDTLHDPTPVDQLSFVHPELNADLHGKRSLQVLDLWMAEADRQGLHVVLDMHSVSTRTHVPKWFVDDPAEFHLIYNNQAYTRDHWIRDLKFVAQRYASNPHFMGIDLYNEPNSVVRWAAGDPHIDDPKYYWKPAAEAAAAAILQVNPRILVFVEGINGNFDGIENSQLPMSWGEDLQPQAYQPLNIRADKLVLAPHSYGPDVFMKSTFAHQSYPQNLPADWDLLFGQFYPQHAVVIGEWGGKYGNGSSGQQDVIWQDAFVDYLISRGMRDTFYWSYTPNSHDSGGILAEDLSVRQDKMALLRRLWGVQQAPPAQSPDATTGEGGGRIDLLSLLLLGAASLRRKAQARLRAAHR